MPTPIPLHSAAQPRLVLTVEQAADCLGVGRTTMFALIASGQVQSVQIGRLRRVPYSALENYLAAITAAQQGEAA